VTRSIHRSPAGHAIPARVQNQSPPNTRFGVSGGPVPSKGGSGAGITERGTPGNAKKAKTPQVVLRCRHMHRAGPRLRGRAYVAQHAGLEPPTHRSPDVTPPRRHTIQSPLRDDHALSLPLRCDESGRCAKGFERSRCVARGAYGHLGLQPGVLRGRHEAEVEHEALRLHSDDAGAHFGSTSAAARVRCQGALNGLVAAQRQCATFTGVAPVAQNSQGQFWPAVKRSASVCSMIERAELEPARIRNATRVVVQTLDSR
jgi:hypothetical protein